MEHARPLGGAVNGGIIFVVAIMAITQLGIDTQLIRTVVLIGLAGTALALAGSFGIDSRDVTRNLMAGFHVRKQFRVGVQMEAAGARGTLTAITPTRTVLAVEGEEIPVPNAVFLDAVARQEETR